MKKPLYILLAIGLIFIAWYCFTNRNIQSPTPKSGNLQPETKLIKITPNIPVKAPRPSPPMETNEAAESANKPINALTATNLEQWKAMIPELHKAPNSEFWVMEQAVRTNGIPVSFTENDKTVSYKVRFIDVELFNDGSLMEVQMHSPIMNIDETRELGLQLCEMLQVDPKNFLAWCAKVGNRWMDQPLFGDGNRHYSFHLLHTYDNEKPWYINFMITPNP